MLSKLSGLRDIITLSYHATRTGVSFRTRLKVKFCIKCQIDFCYADLGTSAQKRESRYKQYHVFNRIGFLPNHVRVRGGNHRNLMGSPSASHDDCIRPKVHEFGHACG